MSLRERKKDKTRTALLETALKLFRTQGFAETTLNQIAAEVDVSARTLLRYFPTKEDIVVSWVEDGMGVFLASFAERPPEEPAHRALMAGARALLAHYEAQAQFYLTIERAIADSPAIRARKLEMSGRLAAQLGAMLERRGAGSAGGEWQARLYPDIVFAMVRAVIGRWVEEDGRPSLGMLFDEAAALVTFAD